MNSGLNLKFKKNHLIQNFPATQTVLMMGEWKKLLLLRLQNLLHQRKIINRLDYLLGANLKRRVLMMATVILMSLIAQMLPIRSKRATKPMINIGLNFTILEMMLLLILGKMSKNKPKHLKQEQTSNYFRILRKNWKSLFRIK